MFFLSIGLCGLIGTIVINSYDMVTINLPIPDFFISEWTNGSQLLWSLILLQSIGSLIGIGLLTKAYQMADTSYLNVFEYSFFIFAGFSGWFILGQTISLYESFGIICMNGFMLGVCSVGSGKGRAGQGPIGVKGDPRIRKH